MKVLLVLLWFFLFVGCFSGYFGNDCEQTCSGHCLENRTCDRIDGTCSDGCHNGYIGKLCNDCKKYCSVQVRKC